MNSRLKLISLALPVLVTVACGDDGNTSASATTTITTTNLTPASSTSDTPTMDTLPTGGATDTGGSMSNSGGQTTTGDPTLTTAGPLTTTTMTTVDTSGTTDGADATAGSTTSGDETTLGTTDPSTTTGQPCNPNDTMGMGDVEKSYLWVANSDEGTVSKVNTLTLIEEGRYRTGPLGGSYAENPSRTAVSLDGRYVVVNGRQSGASTVIAANKEDCVDNNGNGMIDTSANNGDIRPWGQDECMLWTINHPMCASIGCGPRGVTWTPGTFNMDTCQFENPKIWVGYLPVDGLGIKAHMVRLDGATGVVEETVVIDNWSQGWTDYGPYGAALDKDKNVWFTGLRGELFRINTAQNPATFDRWTPPPGTESYGMTVDPDGDPWMAGCQGPVTTFDPDTNTFTAVAGTNACYRGIAADKEGGMWVASNGTCGVMQIDHVTNTVIQFHNFPQCLTPVGVSTDLEGFVWVVDESLGAWKIDPLAPNNKQLVNITGDHYTYSDMTGGQLKSVVQPQ